MDKIKELIASFKPSFLEISLSGRNTLKILKILILSKLLPSVSNSPTTENMTIIKSKQLEIDLKYE